MVELSFIENIQNVCRLCLRSEENMQEIVQCLSSCNLSLLERIFLFYQVKIAKDDGLPNKICKDCFNFTETFTSYYTSVQKCEAKLQALICTAGALGTRIQHNRTSQKLSDSNESIRNELPTSNYVDIVPDGNCEIIVVDPDQEFESSDEENYSEHEYASPTSNTPPPEQNPNEIETQTKSAEFSNGIGVNNSNTTLNNNNNITINNNITTNGNIKNSVVDVGYVDAETENRTAFLCKYCDMAFIGSVECAAHERLHDQHFPYRCTLCAFNAAERQILVSHIKANHNIKPYVCVVCHKGFGRRSDLKKHSIVHTGIRPFTCLLCNKSFSRNTNLTKHMRIHSGLKPFVCQKCPRSFTTNVELENHQKIHDHKEKPYKCEKCPSGFSRKDKLKSHMKVHLKQEANEAINARLNQFDPIGFSNTSAVNRPLSITNQRTETYVPKSNTNYSTDMIYPNTSSNNNSMIPNFENQNNEYLQQQQYQNSIQFPQTSSFLMPNNQLQHSSDPFMNMQQIPPSTMESIMMPPPPPPPPLPQPNPSTQSDYNNMMLKAQYDMLTLQHNFKPEPQKPKRKAIHVCSICAKAFTRKRELQRHAVIHTGQKPFVCLFCDKRFNRKDKLLRHEKIHRDGKFPCPKCKLDFAKKESLNIHLELHEKVERASLPPQQENEELLQPKIPNFLQSLQVGVTPQLNFYSDTI